MFIKQMIPIGVPSLFSLSLRDNCFVGVLESCLNIVNGKTPPEMRNFMCAVKVSRSSKGPFGKYL